MEKLDLATYSKNIKDSYEKVVNGAAERYAIFTVDKSSALTASEVQDGEIVDFVEEFEDGKVQFGLAKVSAPGSDVKKLVLLGWCPENVPLKSKVSFGANFGEVAKVLRGYHVQITARDRDDLDVEDILKTVSDAAGARYSIQSLKGGFKPTSSSRPASKPITPTTTSSSSSSAAVPTKPKPIAPTSKPKPVSQVSKEDDDEWDGEEETVVRDFSEKPLENVASAYKPTKVDIDSLRKGKDETISSTAKPIVKEEAKIESEPSKPLEERLKSYSISDSPDGRLSSLPKYKPSNTVSSRFHEVKTTTFGSKPPAPLNSYSDKDKLVGGLSKNFGASGGKTPAQIWAEKHGKFKTVEHDDEPVNKADIEADYVVVPSKVGSREDEEDQEEEEVEEEAKEEVKPEPEVSKAYSPPPPPVRRSIPPPLAAETEAEAEQESEQEPEPEREPTPTPPSLPQRSVTPEAAPAPPSLPSRTSEPVSKKVVKAVAEYEYKKDEDNEIGFDEGELIVEIEFIDEDWWSGKHSKTGEVGLFPSSYVTIIEDDDSTPVVEKPEAQQGEENEDEGKTAIAEYDYDATEDNELTFKEGDVIKNIEFIDEDWWLGTLNGKRNLFPANYVSLK